MKRCSICGHPGDDSSAVCEVCGNPYTAAEADSSSSAAENKKEKSDEVVKLPEESENWMSGNKTPYEGNADQAASQRRAVRPQNMQSQPGRTQAGRTAQTSAERAARVPAGRVPQEATGRASQGSAERAARGPAGRGAQEATGRVSQGSAERAARGPAGRVPQEVTGRASQGSAERAARVPAGRVPQGPANRAPQGMMPYAGMQGAQLMSQARKALHSPLFLLAVILNTVFVVCSIVNVFLVSWTPNQVMTLLVNFDAPGELLTYAEKVMGLLAALGSKTTVLNLVGKLPEVLFCLGLWIIFLTAGGEDDEMSGAGFILARIVLVLKLIALSIVMLICLVLSVTFVVSAWVAGVQATKITAAVFMALMIVITMAAVMYYFCCLHTVKVCSRNAALGEEAGKASAYAAVVTILAGLVSIVGLLSAIVNVEIVGIFSSAGKIGWMVLMGIWILNYKYSINCEEE